MTDQAWLTQEVHWHWPASHEQLLFPEVPQLLLEEQKSVHR
jgi:hypothetical protein